MSHASRGVEEFLDANKNNHNAPLSNGNPSLNQPIHASSGPIISYWSVDDGDIELTCEAGFT